METPNKSNGILRSALIGFGFTILFLLIGLILDYALTQILSQFFIPNCSEDCYFQLFNTIFIVVVILSVAGGILRGVRTYKRLPENG